jgi:Carbohydrate family 9 binding domain-like
MKPSRILLLLVAALGLARFTARANDIEPTKEFYTVIYAPKPIVLDGDLAEWSGVPVLADPKFAVPKGSGANANPNYVLFEEYAGGTWTGPDDQTSAVQVVYDADNVYFGFVVTDDYHENAANSAWNGDSIQLMIASEDRTAQVALYNYALGGIEGAVGDIIVNHEAGPGGTEAVVTRNSVTKKTTYEIKLPKDSLGLASLKGGPQFGLGMAINDGDQLTPGQRGWGGLGAHAIVFGKTPSETALFTLAKGNDIEPTKEYYTALRTTAPIVLDGSLAEWTGAPVLSDPKFAVPKFSGTNDNPNYVLFEEYAGGTWTGPDDQTSAVQVVYDADNVYFGFVVTDDYHENAANSAWNGDSIQLMIASSDRTAQVALYNYALGGVEGTIGDIIVNHESGPGGTEAVVTRNATTKKTTYEIKLPVDALGLTAPLTVGTTFGLGMAINDGDQLTPGQRGWGGLGAHSIVFGKTPSETALVTLGTTVSGTDRLFLSAINPGISSFTFRATDKGASVVNPALAKLTLDGVVVLLTSVKNNDATDFSYTAPTKFPYGSSHTYSIEVQDSLGNVVTDSGTFKTLFPLTASQIVPADFELPVVIPSGSLVVNGDDFTVSGPGLQAFPSASNAYQPGDVQEFAYETITGDFDIVVKLKSLTSGPVTDPIDAQAGAGLSARVSLNSLSPSFDLNVANPLGANQVSVMGRAIEGQNYTRFSRTYPGVDLVVPNQWLRLRRVGDFFAAYVGKDGKSWSLVGQRYQQWPAALLVGTYAFSASYVVTDGVGSGGLNLAVASFSNYGRAEISDTVAPTVASVGTTDKLVVGVKFSEAVSSLTALVPANYTLSQGTVTSVRSGIGGDSVYLTVEGLSDNAFTVTVNNVKDTAGNVIAANSKATGKSSNWVSSDVGLIQDPANRPTPGDDPYRVGQAVAVSSGETETEIEIIGGGSNAWNPGDYLHYLNGATPLKGDFDVMVEVSRNDRPANTAGWANSGLMFRQAVYLPGQEYTVDGTKVPMVANTTYIEGSDPNRAGIPLWREEAGGGYGNGNAGFQWTTPIDGIKGYYLGLRSVDAAGTPDAESSPTSSRWLRVKRTGSSFLFYVSYNGEEWAALDEAAKELPLGGDLLFGFSTMSDTGSAAPPGNAYAGNGVPTPELEGNQNASNYSVQRIRIGTNVAPRPPDSVPPTVSIQSSAAGAQIIFTGTLQAADTLGGAYAPVAGATSPYTVPAGTSSKYYRASN